MLTPIGLAGVLSRSFKMLKATGLPAVMVCSEGECQSVRGEKRKNSIFMPRAQKGTPP